MTKYELDEGPDVDLDTEVVLLQSGERLTTERAEAIIEGAQRGRPSLSGRQSRSPAVSFRLDAETLARVQQLAKREHLSVSQLARRALDDFLASAS